MDRFFDLNSTADRKFLQQWLRNFSADQLQQYIDYAISEELKKNFTYEEINSLIVTKKIFFDRKEFTTGQLKNISWSYSIIERIEKIKADEVTIRNNTDENNLNMPLKHFTLRVAWHDNKWNGTVCNNPEKNIYCNGYHSLLSDRIRREKEKLLSTEIKFAGKPVNEMLKETGNIPPCFWSINVFGKEEIPVKHINPAARKELKPIDDILKANSMFSWPFGFSFVRGAKEYAEHGKYFRNLGSVRVPRFRNKIKENKSIGFIYSKFSNPISYEDMKYLVVGCGIISGKEESKYFGPESEIEKIRNRNRDLRNFPDVNWAIQFSFDPETMVRMPYHEYLEEAKRMSMDTDQSEKLLSRIRVTIDEPELEHCFKYVTMDIDDDEAIFLLSKMKNKLIDAKNDGIISNESLNQQIEKIENLLKYCWEKRTHFPGFNNLTRNALDFSENEKSVLDDFVQTLKENEEDYSSKIKELIQNPSKDAKYKKYKNNIDEIQEFLENNDLSVDDFLTLSMINLSYRQFEKIIKSETGNPNLEIKNFCENPYLLYEEYKADNDPQDSVTGEFVDNPIELFKIDVALFPNSNYLDKNYLQEKFKVMDAIRIRALIIQYLKSLEYYTGDCFDDANNVLDYIKTFPIFYKSENAVLKLPQLFLEKKDEVYDSHLAKKLEIVIANNTKYYYLKEVYEAEKNVQDFILDLLKNNGTNNLVFEKFETYIETSIATLKRNINNFDDDGFAQERRNLYNNIFPNRFFILTGNPGSGKSYEILNIIKYFKANNESYLLLAPTGKATLRLKTDEDFRNSGISAMTIDKFIVQWKKDPNFRKVPNNIIIDEMSMVDLMKLNSLLNFFDPNDTNIHRLILVGDPNQLPPIGFGKPFYDIIQFIKSKSEFGSNIVELEVNCRQELQDNDILTFGKYFSNESELTEEQIKRIEGEGEISKGFNIRYWENDSKLEKLLEEEWLRLANLLNCNGLIEEKLDSLFELSQDFVNNEKYNIEKFQVITPYRSYSDIINQYFQIKVRSDREIEILKLFKNHDKIIRTLNYYDYDSNDLILSNGSIGIALDFNREQRLYFNELENKYLRTYGEKAIRQREKEYFELAYCITIHKSQGSGFDHLFVILPKKFGILCKELFYTALTRSKKSITILIEGKKDDPFENSLFEFARNRTYTENRKTSLMLDNPFKFYGLEPEPNVYVQSRVEQMIYRHMMTFRDKYKDSHGFDFVYEKYPVVNDTIIRMKTDFTIYNKTNVYYWEHLGLLSKKHYKMQWLEYKLPLYKKYNLLDSLITTDELNGISDEKIIKIINDIFENKIDNEDKYKHYSDHHYSLR